MIRAAEEADARALAELEVRAWRWAYVDFIAEEDMPAVAEREEGWRAAAGPDAGTFVADVEGRVAGVVRAVEGEITALYVEPAAQGAGLGAALLDYACERLRATGYAEAMLWVFDANGHARGFYERRGWAPDGARRERLGAPELRYRQNPAV